MVMFYDEWISFTKAVAPIWRAAPILQTTNSVQAFYLNGSYCVQFTLGTYKIQHILSIYGKQFRHAVKTVDNLNPGYYIIDGDLLGHITWRQRALEDKLSVSHITYKCIGDGAPVSDPLTTMLQMCKFPEHKLCALSYSQALCIQKQMTSDKIVVCSSIKGEPESLVTIIAKDLIGHIVLTDIGFFVKTLWTSKWFPFNFKDWNIVFDNVPALQALAGFQCRELIKSYHSVPYPIDWLCNYNCDNVPTQNYQIRKLIDMSLAINMMPLF